MKKSVVNIDKKMGVTTLTVVINILILVNGVSSICVQVPNNDMIEYSCVAGHPSDLYTIPERAEKIRIQNMSIPRVTSDTFSRFGSNLWVLTCTYCGITEIEPNALETLVNLQQLVLDNNRLRDVKASWFLGMNDLTYLDLNYNEISHIEDDVYKNLPRLMELRVSGNRLQCLNLDAMTNLPLRRMFISNNPEFKCPNAVSKFLEDRKVIFDEDPEWKRMEHDLLPASGLGSAVDWREHPIHQSSTATYHEKLISLTTEEPPEDDYSYEYEKPSTELENSAEIDPYDRNRGWSASSPTPYPTRERPTSMPTSSVPTNRGSSSSMPNSYPTEDWRREPAPPVYPTRIWQTTTADYANRDRTEWRVQPEVPRREEDERPSTSREEIYERGNYSPDTTRASTTMNVEQPVDEGILPIYSEHGIVTSSTSNENERPTIELSGYPGEDFREEDISTIGNVASGTPSRETNPPSMSDYRPNVHQYPGDTGHPSPPEDIYQPPPHSGDSSHPQILEKYQQVQEPASVTIPPAKKDNEKSENHINSSSRLGVSIVVFAIGIVLTIQ